MHLDRHGPEFLALSYGSDPGGMETKLLKISCSNSEDSLLIHTARNSLKWFTDLRWSPGWWFKKGFGHSAGQD